MPKINPKNEPGFLVARIARRLKTRIREFIAESDINLTPEELAVLTAIAHLESAKSMNTLAELLDRDPTTLKRQLNGLIQSNFVDRSYSEKDGRVVLISVSEKGRAVVEATMPMTLALKERTLMGISETEKTVLVKALTQMLKNLGDCESGG